MEAAATSSSSKVIIQCTDPSNVIDVFRERLEPRTPLKNLHWKSPSRPLRSIPSLNISLSRNEPSQNGAPSNTRRHQIPGLRETPYVKLYLLRCDDKETYKETARKEIKQWIRENTFEKESKSVLKNQEHHDAFEWMIVHVVLPGTQASSQPQSSKHISLNDTESTDSVNSKSKWTGKSTSTIHDKLRADFSSSKLPIPRVAQVRILDPAKPPGALGPTDVEEQWREFVDNLKASILKSFDTRVAQYEDDIRERESQRSLPGWNFCTFFVLKEGLARGFESVGLLEDALAVYSELEAGLDAVVQQSRSQGENDVGGALLPYSKDLKSLIRKALNEDVEDTDGELSAVHLAQLLAQDRATSPFDAEKRRYRDMILANDVSPLDVRTYIFTRQIEILLRRAKSIASSSKSSAIDLETMAELADLGLNFVNLASRELRMDVQAAWGGRLSGEERAIQKVVIGNVVASWTWAATVQIINYLLPHLDFDLHQFDESNDVLEEDHQLSNKPAIDDDNKSESSRPSSPPRGLRPESLSSNTHLPQSSDGQGTKIKSLKRPGTDHLCSTVAKLFLLLRKTVENLPAVMGWVEEIRRSTVPNNGSSNKVQLHRLASGFNLPTMNGNDLDSHLPDAVVRYRLRALTSTCLIHATSSEEAFHQIYRLLSKVMHHLFVKANSKHSARQVLIDLAMLAFAQNDLPFTRQCISTILEAESDEPVISSQPHVLSMYAECLRKEDRPNDLAQCLIELLHSSPATSSPNVARAYSQELQGLAARVNSMDIPLETLIKVVSIDRHISHKAAAGGLTLSLELSSTFPAELAVDFVSVSLKPITHSESQIITARSVEPVTLNGTATKLDLQSSVSAHGWYDIHELDIKIGNLRLHRSFSPSEATMSVAKYKPMLVASDAVPLLVYPNRNAPRLTLSQSTLLDLETTRFLDLTAEASDSDLKECKIHVRPATAGLRLNLLDAKAFSGTDEVAAKVEHDHAGTVLKLGTLTRNSKIRIEIPYSLESQAESSISLKCVVGYRHGEESYSLHQTCSAQVQLSLSVSVQDMHRSGHQYSTFSLATATSSPVELIGCTLDQNEELEVQTAEEVNRGITIFNKQPARWLVRLKQKDKQSSSKKAVRLKIQYRCIDEAALASLAQSFSESVLQAEFEIAAEFLTAHLIATVREKWSEYDLELVGLLREMEKWPKSELGWQQVLPAFPRPLRTEIDEWLVRWHSDGQSIPVDLETCPIRELRLKADIQPPPPVFTTMLQIQLPAGQTTATLGQPLMSTFTISIPTLPNNETAQMSYELFAQPDAWLIGGRKKGTITCGSDPLEEQQTITLFPQRTGRLLLPSIELRCRKRGENAYQTGQDGAEVPIEVYNKSISTSVHVTPGLKSATIGLTATSTAPANGGATAGGGSGILLQSQMR